MKTLFVIVFSFLILVGCQKTSGPVGKPTVVVSIAPYKFFVESIAKDKVETLVLVPHTANPHIFEPTAKLMEKASHGKLWFQIGETFESKAKKSLKIPSVDLTKNVSLIQGGCSCHHDHHHNVDVHLWLSPKVALIQVDTILAALVETFPEDKAFFEENASLLKKELVALDKELSDLFAPLSHKKIFVSHGAFAYLCRDYGLEQRSIEQEGKEPSLKHLSHLKEEAEGEKISTILTQAQHDNKGAVRLSSELGISTALVDPYSPDYLVNLRKLAWIIASQN